MSSIEPSELSILLIEPSDMQSKVIINQLKQHDINKITLANCYDDALAHINKHHFDLIASAMYFEQGTAIELLKASKESKHNHDTSFMLVSSECKREHLEEYKQSGVVAILPKPFTPEHLHAAINNTIDLISGDEMDLEFFDVHEIRVLLVDDSRLARNHIRRVLNNLGLLKVTEAEDGSQAIALLDENMYDLIVTDFNMPEVDGRELTKYVREQSQQSHIPILMVTSESKDTHLANIEQDGVNALCDKPFEPDFVKQLLYKVLDH